MNYEENNKLIAEFMGGQRVLPDKEIYNMPTHNNLCYGIDELQYHISWDWLMPVVSKITRDERYWENDYREHLMDIAPYGRIVDTYSAVVEFIKEYNK